MIYFAFYGVPLFVLAFGWLAVRLHERETSHHATPAHSEAGTTPLRGG
jgi:hypothetical protein